MRQGGSAPALTDEEVLTRELGGEYCKLPTDKALFVYLRTPYAPFLPPLPARPLFVRHATPLGQGKAASPQRLTPGRGQAPAPGQLLDTLARPVCGSPRRGRERGFTPVADSGPCAAKNLDYSGFKLGVRRARGGMITCGPVLPARPPDLPLWAERVEGFAGRVPADKGFSAAFRQARLAERQGVFVVTAPRQGLTTPHRPPRLKACARRRKGSEPVGAPLTERFAVARLRVHELWHFQQRLIRQVRAHTVGVVLNLQPGQPALDLDGLVTV